MKLYKHFVIFITYYSQFCMLPHFLIWKNDSLFPIVLISRVLLFLQWIFAVGIWPKCKESDTCFEEQQLVELFRCLEAQCGHLKWNWELFTGVFLNRDGPLSPACTSINCTVDVTCDRAFEQAAKPVLWSRRVASTGEGRALVCKTSGLHLYIDYLLAI